MKKLKLILPVAAILFAVAGVFATGNVALVEQVKYTTTVSCIADGVCSQTTAATCTWASDPSKTFVKISGPTPCAGESTGLFTELD
jgi:hypothetical protein